MNVSKLLLLAALWLVPAFGFSDEAEARRRGLALIGFGESISEAGELPSDVKAVAREATGEDVTLGYKYESISLFFMNVWTWDGQWVLESDESYYPLDDETQAALGFDPEEAGYSVPWTVRFPPALIIIVVGVVLFIASAVLSKDGEPVKSETADGE